MATKTNTFSSIAIDRNAFEAAFYADPGAHPDTPTLCTAPITVGRQIAGKKGWELTEGTAAWADPAGLINRRTYEELRDEILDQLATSMPFEEFPHIDFVDRAHDLWQIAVDTPKGRVTPAPNFCPCQSFTVSWPVMCRK